MSISHTLSTCKHYVYSSIIVLAMMLFLAGCPSLNDTLPPKKNDSKPLLTITPTQASVTEGGTSALTITRENDEGELVVTLNISGSAEHNVDYTVDSNVDIDTDSSTGDKTMTVVFEDSKKSVDITVTAENDGVPEDNGEEVVITIKESGDYTIGDPSTATLTIVDPALSDAPVVSTSDTSNAVNEGGSIIVTISSNQPVTDNLDVILIIGGTATIDEDYALRGVTTNTSGDTVTATVSIPSGNTEAMLTIDAIDNSIHELNANLTITISDEPSTYRIKEDEETVIVTITDDDLPTVGFRTTSQTQRLHEGDDGGVTVILERSNDEVRDVLTVQLKIEGDVESVSDYETLSDTVTFKDGEDTVTITLTAGDDGTKAEEQRVIITIETSDAYTVGDSRTATVTIIDPVVAGSPTISISAGSAEVNEGEDITITVRSNIPVTGELMVSFTIDDVTNSAQQGDDYALDPARNTVIITDGKKSATITIPVHDDNDHEKNEDIQITISDSPSYYIKEGEGSATVTILNDDLPTVGFRTTSQTLQEGDDEGVTVILVRSNDDVRDSLTVELSFEDSTAESGDHTGLTSTASFEKDSDVLTITLTAEDDDIHEGAETVVITISESPLAYGINEGGEVATVTITDDDLPTVSIAVDSVSISESSADGEVEVTEVTLTRSNDEVRGSLTVQLDIKGNAENGKDYETLSNTVTFNDGEDTATITLTAKDDDIPEGEETVVITIIEMPGAYTVGGSRTATVTITDDDLPIVGFRTTSQAQTLEEGDSESVTVTMERSNDEALLPLEVQLSFAGNATEGVDFEPITTPITIPRTKASVDFTLQLHDDGDAEGNEEVIITISEMPNAYTIDEENRKVTITIVDDDDTDGDMIPNSEDVDDDNDGLIEIHTLEMLRNVHFNLAGTSYDDEEDDAGTGDPGDTNGAPASQTDHCKTKVNEVFLCGYELTGNLDFTDEESYATGIIQEEWRPNGADNPDDATNEGFPGIGAKTGGRGFNAIFEGNGYSISNLYMRNTTQYYNTGLFRSTDTEAKIRNLGMMNVSIYGETEDNDYVGGLVGFNEGAITASYATGDVDGGAGESDAVGGLVGYNNGGTITASYATGTVDGGAGRYDSVGGLVGWNNGGSITASYTTGDVDGGAGNFDGVGGLVGWNNGGSITASYATGDVDGGAGDNDSVGGLVGYNNYGTITASYASGTVDGGAGDSYYVGGLVGGGSGSITASYGFGTTVGSGGSAGTQKPTLTSGTSITMASQLSQPGSAANETTAPASSSWNAADRNTLDAWDFGTSDQNPALKYADYDGTSGDTYSCGPVPAAIPGTDTPLVCGTTLLPGQR